MRPISTHCLYVRILSCAPVRPAILGVEPSDFVAEPVAIRSIPLHQFSSSISTPMNPEASYASPLALTMIEMF